MEVIVVSDDDDEPAKTQDDKAAFRFRCSARFVSADDTGAARASAKAAGTAGVQEELAAGTTAGENDELKALMDEFWAIFR